MILNRLTIRARITFGSFLLALIFSAGAAFVLQSQVAQILDRTTLELLASDSAPYVSAGAGLANLKLETSGEDQRIAVIDPAGILKLSTLPDRLEGQIASFRYGPPGMRTYSTSEYSYRMLVTRVETAKGTWTVVSVRNDASNQLVLSQLTVGLAWGLAGLSVLFALVSWLLTGAALGPVAQLRRSADSLLRSRSPDLLEVGPARDEVSDLATTLNNLISSLHESAAREKQLVSDASHELRTPLAILQARLELLRRAVPSANRADVSAAEAAVRRLTDLVADLLELSRIEASAEDGVATADELAVALADSVDRSRSLAATTGVTIDYEVSGHGVGGVVGMSRDTFGRVADNLAKNAIAAVGESGDVSLALHVGRHDVTLVVQDDGPGMSAEFLPKAFDRFAREDSARASHQGTGLGLSIVHAAVEAAQGTIRLQNSQPGLRVSVRLPLAPVEDRQLDAGIPTP
ncbi:ATP-binding protein [soil metagenome]